MKGRLEVLDRITDVVLAYRPKKARKAKKAFHRKKLKSKKRAGIR